jgi:hypothetical protein
MTVSRPALGLALAGAALVGVWLASHGPSHAQEGQPAPRTTTPHIADAMLQPIRLPFGEGKSLEEIAAYLRKELKANVVLDLAALDRHDLKPTDRVRIDLDGVRLKTGLKLLLDQVALTTKVIPEDNLLLITDKAEEAEPTAQILEEIRALHRDLHALQDDVRNVRALLELPMEEEPVAKARNPTIIEEKPAEEGKARDQEKPDAAKKKDRSSHSRPGL